MCYFVCRQRSEEPKRKRVGCPPRGYEYIKVCEISQGWQLGQQQLQLDINDSVYQ